MKAFAKYWLPVILWAGSIFFVSSLPGEEIPSLFSGQEIVFHIFEYALLTLLLLRALKNAACKSFASRNLRLLVAIVFCLIYAAGDEFHQQFTSGRVSSVSDFLIDGLGIILGSIIYL
ncbi:VanZ family protein [Candidatus Omnitrophota bacterium]